MISMEPPHIHVRNEISGGGRGNMISVSIATEFFGGYNSLGMLHYTLCVFRLFVSVATGRLLPERWVSQGMV